MENPIEVDVADLEPTGVYLCMNHNSEHINGYEDPKWIHFRAYAYAQFYMYSGEVPDETKLWLHTSEDSKDPVPVLIADSIIDIPESGTVTLDLSEVNFLEWTNATRAMNRVKERYNLTNDRYIDCASPYCEELTSFKDKKFNIFIGVVAAESIIFTIVLVIIASVALSRQKRVEK